MRYLSQYSGLIIYFSQTRTAQSNLMLRIYNDKLILHVKYAQVFICRGLRVQTLVCMTSQLHSPLQNEFALEDN